MDVKYLYLSNLYILCIEYDIVPILFRNLAVINKSANKVLCKYYLYFMMIFKLIIAKHGIYEIFLDYFILLFLCVDTWIYKYVLSIFL